MHCVATFPVPPTVSVLRRKAVSQSAMVDFGSLHNKKKQKPSPVLFLFNVKRHRSQNELQVHADLIDPFTAALEPPPDEDEDSRAARIKNAEEAERKSREIDDDIAESKKMLEKKRKGVKLLLLGVFSRINHF